jgi:glycosyltransferase involved in cell wall biosynthesis
VLLFDFYSFQTNGFDIGLRIHALFDTISTYSEWEKFMDHLVSVIVPIYNVERFLERCFESIFHQTYKNYEIIAIDDGSTDESASILDSLAQKDSRIKAIHQNNMGVAATRNVGLSLAQGEYVLFVDSDDTISPTGIDHLLKKAVYNNLDIAYGAGFRISITGKVAVPTNKPDHLIDKVLTGPQYMEEAIRSKSYNNGVWNKLYKRSFLIENECWFKEGLVYEDILWSPQVFLKARRVQFVDVDFANIFVRHGAITQDPYNLAIRHHDSLYIFDTLTDIYIQANISEDQRMVFLDYVTNRRINLLKNYRAFYSKEQINDNMAKIKKYAKLWSTRVNAFSLNFHSK